MITLARPIGHVAFTQVLLPHCFGLAWKVQAQICQVSYEMNNRNGEVPGPVNGECRLPNEWPQVPFGTWGVVTEASSREDGFQFAGWYREKDVCDSDGECWQAGRNSWYEWNTCTSDVPRLRPQIHYLYNAADGGEQRSAGTASVNTHGLGILSLTVSCPVDTDGDYYPDEGGCTDALDHGFSLSGHRMELYELDHWRPWDGHVGTLYSPRRTASGSGTNCYAYGCDGGRTGSFRSPLGGTSAAHTGAAVRVTGAGFRDENGPCCDPLEDPTCD